MLLIFRWCHTKSLQQAIEDMEESRGVHACAMNIIPMTNQN